MATPGWLGAELYSISGVPAATVPEKWKSASTRKHSRTFGRLDVDKNESLTVAELQALTRQLEGTYEKTTALVHGWFDSDGSGGIDFGEWQDGRRDDGDPVAPEMVGESALELDRNGNGRVSRREFWRVISRFVCEVTTRSWFRAQFPGGQVTGSSSSSIDFSFFTPIVIGWDTPGYGESDAPILEPGSETSQD